MKVEYAQFRSMKKASSNLAYISSHYKDSKKQRGGKKRNSKEIQEYQEIEKRYKYPIKSLGHALLQDSEDKECFKPQRTAKKECTYSNSGKMKLEMRKNESIGLENVDYD